MTTIPTHVSENVVEIDLAAVRSNYLTAKRLLPSGQRIMAVVKSDGYGHGIVEVSKELVALGCDFFAVFNLEEGMKLREVGIRTPILIMKGVSPGQAALCVKHDLTPAVFDLEVARLLNEAGLGGKDPFKVHVKIDTGLGRLGVPHADTAEFLRTIQRMRGLNVDGVMSHLSVPGPNDYTRMQIVKFEEALAIAREMGFRPVNNSVGNSVVLISRLDGHGDLVRLGIFLYGGTSLSVDESGEGELEPAMRFKTRIIQVKSVDAGASISYGRTYITDGPQTIATIPVGYNDGYSRLLSNAAQALVRGKRVRVAGRICMNLTMLNVTGLPDVRVGEEVVLLGKQGKEEITVAELAAKADTISYELLCSLGCRNERVYVNREHEREKIPRP